MGLVRAQECVLPPTFTKGGRRWEAPARGWLRPAAPSAAPRSSLDPACREDRGHTLLGRSLARGSVHLAERVTESVNRSRAAVPLLAAAETERWRVRGQGALVLGTPAINNRCRLQHCPQERETRHEECCARSAMEQLNVPPRAPFPFRGTVVYACVRVCTRVCTHTLHAYTPRNTGPGEGFRVQNTRTACNFLNPHVALGCFISLSIFVFESQSLVRGGRQHRELRRQCVPWEVCRSATDVGPSRSVCCNQSRCLRRPSPQ